MMNNRNYIISLIFLLALAAIYGIPRPKYHGTNVLQELDVPLSFGAWHGQDNPDEAQPLDDKFNFINTLISRTYTGPQGETLDLMILDAGNFHNPKICMGGAGYIARDLPDLGVTFPVEGKKRDFTEVYFTKDNEGDLVIYWIVINKKQVNWTQQKFQEFFYSIFNKKKVGLMVRLDIAAKDNDTAGAEAIAQDFIRSLSSKLTLGQRDIIFGQ
jgi:EpsI family protein